MDYDFSIAVDAFRKCFFFQKQLFLSRQSVIPPLQFYARKKCRLCLMFSFRMQNPIPKVAKNGEKKNEQMMKKQ